MEGQSSDMPEVSIEHEAKTAHEATPPDAGGAPDAQSAPAVENTPYEEGAGESLAQPGSALNEPGAAPSGDAAPEWPEGQCLEGALEALLFVTDEPVSALVLASRTGAAPSQVNGALEGLAQRYAARNAGIALREVAGGWRLFTNPAYHTLVEDYVVSWDTRKLSAAAMETLAIVAYAQPVTRAGIAAVRGVNSDSPLHSLAEKGLIREAGIAEAPGNPVLYGTSRVFLEKFGLRSTADLPSLEDFAPDAETAALIRERLSASREDAALMRPVPDEMEPPQTEGAQAGLSAGNGAGGADAFDAAEAADADGASIAQALGDQLVAALAASAGVVEKIDFESLVFDTDDE